MAKERNALKAGTFILVSIALAFSIVVAIKGILLEATQVRTVSFTLEDDLGGLRVGDDVRIGGFKVGEIRKIEVAAAGDPRLSKLPTTRTKPMILVTTILPSKYELREGTCPAIQSTVTGQSCLNFSSLGQGKLLPSDLALRGRPSEFSALLKSLSDMGPKLNSIVTQVRDQTIPGVNDALAEIRHNTMPGINGILQDVRGKTVPTVNDAVARYAVAADTATKFINELRDYLRPIIERYYTVADSARNMMDEVADVFGSTKGDFRSTVKNLNSASATINVKVSSILGKTDDALTKAGNALKDIEEAARNTRDLTGHANEIVAASKSRLQSILRHIEGTARNLELAGAEIMRRPWRMLYFLTPRKDEEANLNLFNTVREFAQGASDLNDAAQALRDAVKEQHPDAGKIKELQDRMDERFKTFTEIERRLWEAAR
jgi:ABC-type transporter Mla subunit MlaD